MSGSDDKLAQMISFVDDFIAAGNAEIHQILAGHQNAMEMDDAVQRSTASDFNLLDVLGVANRETRHCRVLAWLLDHRRRELGTHAQGAIAFRMLLEAIRLPIEYASHDYQVRTEVSGDSSRIDVEILCRGQFLIHVEAKVYAGLHDTHLQREWDDAHRRAETFDIPDAAVHLVYLTRRGDVPKERQIVPVSWQTIARVAEQFARVAQPPDVKLFAAHYGQAVRQFAADIVLAEVQPQ